MEGKVVSFVLSAVKVSRLWLWCGGLCGREKCTNLLPGVSQLRSSARWLTRHVFGLGLAWSPMGPRWLTLATQAEPLTCWSRQGTKGLCKAECDSLLFSLLRICFISFPVRTFYPYQWIAMLVAVRQKVFKVSSLFFYFLFIFYLCN